MAGFLLVLFLTVTSQSRVNANIKLPGLISDHMVLQRGVPVNIWGWADPGEQVTVKLADQTKSTTAAQDGRWGVTLDKLKPGEPLELTVAGKNTLTIKDVLVGEVWLCSGQSNMVVSVGTAKDAMKEMTEAHHPDIRLFTVPIAPAAEERDDVAGNWVVCTPQSVYGFSAVGYFFGRELHSALKIPIGLINSSNGGTPIEAWTSLPAMRGEPAMKVTVAAVDRMPKYDAKAAEESYNKALAAWNDAMKDSKAQSKPAPPEPHLKGDPRVSKYFPAALFNAMINPLIRYPIRGVIWYQGETNTGNPTQYRAALTSMIKDWRGRWREGDFPFGVVQLPNFMAEQAKPSEDTGGTGVREAQLQVAESVPNVGLAVTIDIGEAGSIHPKNKQDVGHRLALWALNKVYGRDVVFSGPIFNSMKINGDKVELKFKNTGSALEAKGPKLKGFVIAGADKQFHAAEATIEGDAVVVHSAEAAAPIAVRYGWADNPVCNLYNKEGLPASPFRTDDWPLVTVGKWH